MLMRVFIIEGAKPMIWKNRVATAFASLGFVLVASGSAQAGYHRTGPVSGTVCSGFIIQSCAIRRIDAVRNTDGSLYTFKAYFDSVDEYHSQNGGLCHVKVGRFQRQAFLEQQPDGSYEEIHPDYVTFHCRKE